MGACGSDVDMGALGVLVAEPLERFLDLEGALPFPENHFAAVAPHAKVEAPATAQSRFHLGEGEPVSPGVPVRRTLLPGSCRSISERKDRSGGQYRSSKCQS